MVVCICSHKLLRVEDSNYEGQSEDYRSSDEELDDEDIRLAEKRRTSFSPKTKSILLKLLEDLRVRYPHMKKKELARQVFYYLRQHNLASCPFKTVLTWVYNNTKYM